MKLYERLPNSVTVNGKRIRLNLDYRNVLRMKDILERDDLLPEAQEYLAMKCVCRHPKEGMKSAVMNLLFPKTNSQRHERITDFEQDADLIRSAFLQVYGIDLYTKKLHWFKFIGLLSCIPEGNRYSDVLSIRARPIPKATPYNADERMWLMKAKNEVGLKLTEQEQHEKLDRDIANVGAFLLSMVKGDG